MGNATLVFNLALAVVGAGVLAATVRWRRIVVLGAGLALIALAAFYLALTWGEDVFGAIRLLSWGVFLHGFVLFAGGAVILHRADRKGALLSASAALVLALVALDAFLIEPRWLRMTRYEVAAPGLSRPLNLLVLADLQTDRIGAYERRTLARAMATAPDLILLTGDYVHIPDRPRRVRVQRELNQYLHELGFDAPLGIYAVGGNCDPTDWERTFADLPVTVVKSSRTIDLPELRLTGLSMDDSSRPRVKIPPSDRFHVVFGHCPDFALSPGGGGDLLVAGHTHGGQVRLPFRGPLIIFSQVPRSWAAGRTDLGSGRTLVVSRGIGMERSYAPRLRFLCRPEVVVIRLVPG